MTRRTRRLALTLVGAAVLVVGVIAVALASRGGTGTAASSTPEQPAGQSTQPAGAAPIAVPTSAAPSSLPIEPGPTDPVATDVPVPATGGDVSVVLGFAEWDAAAGQLEAAGYVSGVVENGGTCALDLTAGGQHVQATSAAEADATTTTCGALSVPGDQLADGTWTATLHYGSATSQGTSGPVTVAVRR